MLASALGVAVILVSRKLEADPPATTQPTILQQLSDETQRLYVQSRHSMVLVRLPSPQWLEQFNDRQAFLRKWGSVMDPANREALEKIMEEQDNLPRGPTTASATAPALSATPQPLNRIGQPAPPNIALYAVGLRVDDQGYAVFPVFVDRKYIGDSILPAVTGDGEVTTARFVGSDAMTNLTVLQLTSRRGTPAPLGHRRPEDGALTLAITSNGEAKLVVWTHQHPEPGFSVLADGSVAGFGFGGHFLGASTAKPIVDQLIATGEVHRALLGVVTQEVGNDDPIRRLQPELGSSPAIRIIAVQDGSPAARGGIAGGDLILTIGDEAVGDPPTFAAVIATRRGETSLRVLRGSKVIELTVNLQAK